MKLFFGTAGTPGTEPVHSVQLVHWVQPAHAVNSVHSLCSVARYTRCSRHARYNRSSRILTAVAVVEGGFFEIEFTSYIKAIESIKRVLLPVRNSIYAYELANQRVAWDRCRANLSEATRKQRSCDVD